MDVVEDDEGILLTVAAVWAPGCPVDLRPPVPTELRPPPEHEGKPWHWLEARNTLQLGSEPVRAVFRWSFGAWHSGNSYKAEWRPEFTCLRHDQRQLRSEGWYYLGPAEWRPEFTDEYFQLARDIAIKNLVASIESIKREAEIRHEAITLSARVAELETVRDQLTAALAAKGGTQETPSPDFPTNAPRRGR